RDLPGLDGRLPVIVAFGGVLRAEIGAAVLAHPLRPVHLIVIVVERRRAVVVAGHAVALRGEDDPAPGAAGEIEGERARLAGVAGEAGPPGHVAADLPEAAAQPDLHRPELAGDADSGAGDHPIGLGDLVDAGHRLHGGAEAGLGDAVEIEPLRPVAAIEADLRPLPLVALDLA